MNDWTLRSRCYSLLLAQLFVTAAVSGVSIVRENILEGSNATLRCDIERLHDDVQQTSTTYYWRKGIVANAVGAVILFYNSPTGSDKEVTHSSLIGRARFKPPVLSITNLKVSDSGYYSCEITSGNDGHRETKIFEVQVNAIPRVSVRRIDNPIINKDTQLYEAAFCQALRSKPNASVYWINANTGTRVEGSGERIVVSADGTSNATSVLRLKPGLIGRAPDSIDPVTAGETIGNFTCVAIHDWFPNDNKRLEKTIGIELLYPPRASVSVDGNRITCDAIGNPMPDVTWTRPDGSIAKGRRHIYVDQSTPDRSSGRYTCQATSLIASATAVINIEKSKQLPTILSTTLRYETAIPMSARNFDMECTAELEGFKSPPVDAIFKWMRNGFVIDDDTSYQVMVNTSVASPEKTIVSSTLRIIQVMRSIDGNIFRCRLDISDQLSGYVRSVERSIRLKVDYPPSPGSISVSFYPHPAAKEGEDVTLRCTATSMPPSSYRWFYEGKVLSSSSQLRLMNVSRYEAGKYKCVAFNYVPGSVSSEVNVAVHYPPGDVAITKTRDSLDCSTTGGSIPAPFYTWLLPNGTTTSKNTSALRISSLDTHRAASYICLVRNKLAEKNSTYFLQPSKLGIGSLSIAGFSMLMVAVFLAIVILIAILCFAKHRHVRKRSPSDNSLTLNRSNLLGYAENSSVDGSLASTPAPHNVFDDDSVTVPKYDEAARADESIGDSQGTSSKMKSVETLPESGVEMLERCPFESPMKSLKPCAIVATMENQRPNGQLKLSTFSQPASTGEFNAVTPNYFTIRNQNRSKHEAILTRAFSETFKAGHLGLAPKADIGLVNRLSPSVLATGQNAQVALPPSYSQLTFSRNSQAGRRGITSPIPVSQSSVDGDRKNDEDDTFRLSEATTLSPKRLTSPVPHGLLRKMDKIPPNKFTIRNNLIPYSINRACSPLDSGLRDGITPPRCQSVDTTREAAAVIGMTDRKYAYRPYPDGSMTRTSTNVAFNKSDGTDSIAPTSITNGGKLQSLTLV